MRQIALFICLTAILWAGLALAQPATSPNPQVKAEHSSQPLIGPGVKHNIVSIEKAMREIHQLMFLGPFTPDQDTKVTNMMIRLGQMMKEMSGPHGEKLAKQHERELKEISRQIEILKQQLKKNQ